MSIPIRCFTCGRITANQIDYYNKEKLKLNKDEKQIDHFDNNHTGPLLDKLGVTRYCCRRMLLTTVETIQQVIPFYESIQKRKQEVQSELD